MRTVSAQEIQRMDQIAIKAKGISSLALMETAGRAVAFEVIKHLKRTHKKSVCVVCGLGNNAGDGFVIARTLYTQGVRVEVILLGNPQKLSPDATANYRAAKSFKIPMTQVRFKDMAPLCHAMRQCDVIVDAIFGVGLNRTVEGLFHRAIKCFNFQKKYVVAVDVPSGLDATTGHIHGIAVKANKTVTFTLPKKGFFKRDGAKYTGRVKVVEIGVPVNVGRLT